MTNTWCLLWCQTLLDCRKEVCAELAMAEEECELSMGMSADFEQAVSTNSCMLLVTGLPKKHLLSILTCRKPC